MGEERGTATWFGRRRGCGAGKGPRPATVLRFYLTIVQQFSAGIGSSEREQVLVPLFDRFRTVAREPTIWFSDGAQEWAAGADSRGSGAELRNFRAARELERGDELSLDHSQAAMDP